MSAVLAVRHLNPLTPLTLAVAASVDASLLRGFPQILVLFVLVVALPSVVAGQTRRILWRTVLLTTPLAVSALLINGLFDPAAPASLGPFRPGWAGLALGLAAAARALVYVGSAVLFLLTTSAIDLQLDLERRGLPARFAYVLGAAVQAVPEAVERAHRVREAQEARGLDTSGSLTRRLAGIRPLAGAIVLGSIYASQERAQALHQRAFGQRSHRTLLWSPADSRSQAIARWLLVLSVPLVVLARAGVPGF